MPLRSLIFWLALLFGLSAVGIWVMADLAGSVLIVGDSRWFQPITYNFASTGQLAHPFMSPISNNAGVGGPLLWHGWMMPEVLGTLVRVLRPNGSIAESSFANHLLAGLIFTGYAVLFGKRVRYALLYMPIFLTLFLYQSGRPDLLASLYLLAFLWLRDTRQGHWHLVLNALILAAIAASSPNAAVMLSFYMVLKETTSGRSRKLQWQFYLSQLILAPIFLAALTLWFTDFSLSDYLKGLAAHSGRLLGRDDGNLINYYVFNPNLPFMFVFVALLAIWLLALARKPHGAEFWLAALLFVCFLYITSFAAPPMVYNLAWIIPLVLYDLANLENKSRAPLALTSVLSFVFFLSAALFTAGKIVNLRSGVPAARLVAAVQALPNTPIITTRLAAIAALQPEIGLARFSTAPERAQVRIVLQAITLRHTPQVGPNECLLVSTFHANDPYTLLPKLRQDWAFAIIAQEPCEKP